LTLGGTAGGVGAVGGVDSAAVAASAEVAEVVAVADVVAGAWGACWQAAARRVTAKTRGEVVRFRFMRGLLFCRLAPVPRIDRAGGLS